VRDTHRQRLLLILTLAAVALVVVSVAVFFLYQTAFQEEKERLVETAQSQARLMEAVARFDSIYSHNFPEGTEAATLSQIIEARKKFEGFGRTGEFLLARHDGDQIKFLLSHRHSDLIIPESIPFNSPLGEPIRRALNGESGTMVGPDYRNETVLAAYEPVHFLNLGLVAKIDLAEVREPFYKAALASLGVGMVVIFFGIVLFWRLSNPMVEEITHSRERMRNLAHRLQDIREEEKTRIAREVHDELGQSLTALKLDLHCLEEEIKTNNFSESFKSINQLIDHTITSVQRISTELRPQMLDVFGLAETIQWQIREYQNRSEIQFDLSGLEFDLSIEPRRETTLFRVFQETLTNILRHAQSTRVEVALTRKNDSVILKIRDNGVGIPPDKINSAQSLGLLGIRERVAAWEGRVEIESPPGEGTTVMVTIPLSENI